MKSYIFAAAATFVCYLAFPGVSHADAAKSKFKAEIHLMLCPASLQDLLMRLDLNAQDSSLRQTWYFDTPKLALVNSDQILRVRKKESSDHATLAVKIRDLDFNAVPDSWFKDYDFSCEWDQYGTQRVSSCSAETKLSEDELSDWLLGWISGSKMLSSLQADLIDRFGQNSVPWAELRGFGPVSTHSWQWTWKEFPENLSLEYWSLSKKSVTRDSLIFELSTRAAEDRASDVRTRLVYALETLGIPLCPEQKSKTKSTLEYLAAQSRSEKLDE